MLSTEQKHHLPINLTKDRVYLDIETTKTLVPLEVSLIDNNGDIMFSSLIRPADSFFNENKNSKLHVGISDEDLLNAKYTWLEASKIIKHMLNGRIVWVYNYKYDSKFFDCRLTSAFNWYCAMERFAYFHGDYQLDWRGGRLNNKPKWQGLEAASNILGITNIPQKHRSLDDAKLLREVVLALDKQDMHRRSGMNYATYNLSANQNKKILNFNMRENG